MHSKALLTILALVGAASAAPTSASPSTSPFIARPSHFLLPHGAIGTAMNATLPHPPTTPEESDSLCETSGAGISPIPGWYWNKLHKGFKTRTDIFMGSQKVRFAKFTDPSCGLCPVYPHLPRESQVGAVNKLKSGRCKDFKRSDEWNSFMFDFGSHVSECRIDVYSGHSCQGVITNSYDGTSEEQCNKIPHGGKSVRVSCGESSERIERLFGISEVESCPAADAEEKNADDDICDGNDDKKDSCASNDLNDTCSSDDDDDDDKEYPCAANNLPKIQTVISQTYKILPANGTAFAYYKDRDCGACNGSNEVGTAILLQSNMCQTLSANETANSMFFKAGDLVRDVKLLAYTEAGCKGEPIGHALDIYDAKQCQGVEGAKSVRAFFDAECADGCATSPLF